MWEPLCNLLKGKTPPINLQLGFAYESAGEANSGECRIPNQLEQELQLLLKKVVKKSRRLQRLGQIENCSVDQRQAEKKEVSSRKVHKAKR
jgi:hypothetical protein